MFAFITNDTLLTKTNIIAKKDFEEDDLFSAHKIAINNENYCPAEELEKGDLQILKYMQKYDNQ